MNPTRNRPSHLGRPCLKLLLIALLLHGMGCSHRRGGSTSLSQYEGETGSAYPFSSEFAGVDDYEDQEGLVPLTRRPRGVSFDSAQVRKDLFSPIHFGFDQYEVTSDQLPKIRQVADYLRTGTAQLILAGHTDLVGTAEYNRNLGERRALAVRGALIREGIHPSRIQTVSFGEDRPARSGSSESAHSANRRAEFGLHRSDSN